MRKEIIKNLGQSKREDVIFNIIKGNKNIPEQKVNKYIDDLIRAGEINEFEPKRGEKYLI